MENVLYWFSVLGNLHTFCIIMMFPSATALTNEEEKEYELLCNHCIVTSIGFIHLEAAPLIDWLNKHHFDYRGLIEKGLAIEVTKDFHNPYERIA